MEGGPIVEVSDAGFRTSLLNRTDPPQVITDKRRQREGEIREKADAFRESLSHKRSHRLSDCSSKTQRHLRRVLRTTCADRTHGADGPATPGLNNCDNGSTHYRISWRFAWPTLRAFTRTYGAIKPARSAKEFPFASSLV